MVDFPLKPFCVVLALCWLGASPCAGAEPQNHDRPRDPGKASSDSGAPGLAENEDEKKEDAPKPRAIKIGAVRDEVPSPIAPRSALEARVTVRVKGASLADYLDSISAQSKVNFILGEGLEEKKVTAFLRDVTVREALEVLLELKGLTYLRIGKSDSYVIMKRSEEEKTLKTRVYRPSFIPLSRPAAEKGKK